VARARKRKDEFVDKALQKDDEKAKKDMEVDNETAGGQEKRGREEQDEQEDGDKKKTRGSSSSSAPSVDPAIEAQRGLARWISERKRKAEEEEEEAMEVVPTGMEMPVLEVHMEVVNQELEETPSFEDGWAMDDLSGKTLCRKAVGEARSEEMEFMKKIGVYEERADRRVLKEDGGRADKHEVD